MKHHRYTPEEVQFIKNKLSLNTYAELTEMFNKRFGTSLSRTCIKAYASNNNLRNTNQKNKYTPEEMRFLEDNIAGRSYAELTEMFNKRFNCSVSKTALKGILSYHGRKNGLSGRFYRGCIYNRVPIGSECIDKSNGYVSTKVANPSIWRKKHHVIWEAANGPIPDGHAIIFADRNKLNFDLKNLILVSRRELDIMNRKHLVFPDAELTRDGLLIAKIIIQINDRKREKVKGGA